jgi:hypothetical protein
MTYKSNELAHYGVLGMRWGRRRYTNPDGTLNALGKKHKAMMDAKDEVRKTRKDYARTARENEMLRTGGLGSAKRDAKLGEAAKASIMAKEKYERAKKDFKDLKKQTMAELKGNKTVSRGSAAAGAILGTLAGTAVVVGGAYAVKAKVASEMAGFAKDLLDG